ncbi:DNA-3-methyladenine glycosylase I [Macrococcoides caseolyticum]
MEIVRMIRNRLKVRSIMSNVQVFMKVREQYGTFDRYIWVPRCNWYHSG